MMFGNDTSDAVARYEQVGPRVLDYLHFLPSRFSSLGNAPPALLWYESVMLCATVPGHELLHQHVFAGSVLRPPRRLLG